jgi:5'-nucleotidase
MRRFPSLLVLAATAVTFSACNEEVVQPRVDPPEASEARKPRSELRPDFVLTLLHNNDGESELLPDGAYGGIGRFARTVAELKAEAVSGCPGRPVKVPGQPAQPRPPCDVILLSSGDNILAGPQFSASLDKGIPFFDAIALDRIGYDALAIGNHELDFGPDVLADFIEGFQENPAPFLSANLDVSPEPRLAALEPEGRIASSTIVKVRSDRIGIIGATTPRLREISSPRNIVVLEDVAQAILSEVGTLRQKQVDKIILIAHLQSIEEDLALIPMLDEVDVVVAGGGDELLANPGDRLIPGDESEVGGPYPLIAQDMDGTDVPVITTSGQYRYVGRLRIVFNRAGEILSVQGGPVVVEGEADPEIVAEVEAPVAAAVADLQAEVIGSTEVVLDGRRSQVRTVETNEGNLIADALRWQADQLAAEFGVPSPDVALQNGGGIRNDSEFGPGPVTTFDTFDFLPFPNFVAVFPAIGRADFLAILENAVSRVEFTDGRFAQVSGFSFTFDPSAPAGSRVVDVVLDGGELLVSGGSVVPGPDLSLATIDFLARGGDGYPFGGAPFTSLGVTYQQALADYIQVELGGTVTAADYPAGGEGRITRVP